jgi:hypothetical protein
MGSPNVGYEELIDLYARLEADGREQPAGTTLQRAYHEAGVGVFNLIGAIDRFRALQEDNAEAR